MMREKFLIMFANIRKRVNKILIFKTFMDAMMEFYRVEILSSFKIYLDFFKGEYVV